MVINVILHQRIIVWCNAWYLKAKEEVAVKIYRNILWEFLWQPLEDMNFDESWFEEEGTTCYTNGETITLFAKKFTIPLIFGLSEINWLVRFLI